MHEHYFWPQSRVRCTRPPNKQQPEALPLDYVFAKRLVGLLAGARSLEPNRSELSVRQSHLGTVQKKRATALSRPELRQHHSCPPSGEALRVKGGFELQFAVLVQNRLRWRAGSVTRMGREHSGACAGCFGFRLNPHARACPNGPLLPVVGGSIRGFVLG